jgi:hypothetical protein
MDSDEVETPPPPPMGLIEGARDRALAVAGLGGAVALAGTAMLGPTAWTVLPATAILYQAGVGVMNARWTLNRVNMFDAQTRLAVYRNSNMATGASAAVQAVYFANLSHHFYTNSKKPESMQVVTTASVVPSPGKKEVQVSVDPGTGLAVACAVGMAAVAARCLKRDRTLAHMLLLGPKDKRRGRSS